MFSEGSQKAKTTPAKRGKKEKIQLMEGLLEKYRVTVSNKYHKSLERFSKLSPHLHESMGNGIQFIETFAGEDYAAKMLNTVKDIENPMVANSLINHISKVFFYGFKSRGVITAMVECAWKHKQLPDVGEGILERIRTIAFDCVQESKGEKPLIDMIQALHSDTVINCINRFKDNSEQAREVADLLSLIASDSMKPEAVNDIALIIQSSEEVDKSSLSNLFRGGKFWEYPYDFSGLHGEGLLWGKASRIGLHTILSKNGLTPTPPDLSDKWVSSMKKLLIEQAKSKFGLKEDITMTEALLLSSIQPEADETILLREVINRKLNSKKSFNVGKEYARVEVSNADEQKHNTKQMEYLLGGLLYTKRRRNHVEAMERARRLFPKDLLDSARNFISLFDRKHVYNEIKNDVALIKQGEWRATRNIIRFFIKLTENPGAAHTPKGVMALMDLLRMANSSSPEYFDNVLIRMQSMSLVNIFGANSLHCCALYPEEKNRRASIYYLIDPEIALLRIHTLNSQGKEFTELGIMILVNCQDTDGNKVLLVDSVEGSFEMSNAKLMFKLIAIANEIASENGASRVIFNSKVAGDLPRLFNGFLKGAGANEVKIDLEKIGGVEAISDWSKKHYLEAFGGWRYPKGTVKGYSLIVD